jgi:AraC family transcriptional regulator of adaptative response/methylated-DNA-[protein]-cysteine methyltransferase
MRRSSHAALNNHSAGEEIYFSTGRSSLGPILVATSDRGVVAILNADNTQELILDLESRFPNARLIRDDRECAELVKTVAAFIEDPGQDIDLPLDIRGTEFQKKVWKAVRNIPPGKTSSYSEVARKIGSPKAIRAVGTACSSNNLFFVIPCYRVLHKDGSPGYEWGDRQQELIDREVKASRRGTQRRIQREAD